MSTAAASSGDAALEAAQAKLESLRDRDAILDLFFAHATTIFRFTVLFVVRDNVAHGRDVDGLGAPSGLVTRLAIPLHEGGVLAQGVELRRPVVVSPAADGADAALMGQLGRAMPLAVLAPVVVRGRVVALLLGEGTSPSIRADAEARGVSPAERARDAMAPWAASVGDAFETLIIARKSEDGAPASGVASLRRPLRAREPERAPAPARPAGLSSMLLFIGAGVVGAAAILAFAAWLYLSERGPTLDAVSGSRLPGWPAAVELGPAIEQARAASGLGAAAELLAVRGRLAPGGRLDVSKAPDGARRALSITLGSPLDEVEVETDAEGMRGVRKLPRGLCDGRPCRAPVAPPRSSPAQLWAAAQALGARDDDWLSVSYGAGAERPEWSLSADDRGMVRLADGTNKPMNRDRFRPPALPLASIPEAPRLDPLTALATARAQSGFGEHSALLEIDARGVGSEGRVDLGQASRSIAFRIAEPSTIASSERRWRLVKITSEGLPVTSTATDHDALPALVHGPVETPRCSFADAWARGGLPPDATARIIYRAERPGTDAGEWTLDAPSQATEITFTDRACALAVGKVMAPRPSSPSHEP